MAKTLTKRQATSLHKKEQKNIDSITQEFKTQNKEFTIPDEHWSGVMPEDYRAKLPGKGGDDVSEITS